MESRRPVVVDRTEMSSFFMSDLQPANSPGWELCRSAIGTGVRHCVRHFIGLGLVFATLSASFYLTVDRVGSSMKHVLEQRLNAALVDSGCLVQFDSLQFVEGEGIRVRGVRLQLDASQCVQGAIRIPIPLAGMPLAIPSDFPTMTPAAPGLVRSYKPNYRPVVPRHVTVDIESLWLRGDWTTAELIQGKFQPHTVDIDGLTIGLQLDEQQQLCVPRLSGFTQNESPLPSLESIRVNRGHVKLMRPSGELQHEVSGIQLDFSRVDSSANPSSENLAWQIAGQLNWIAELPIQFSAAVDPSGYRVEARCRRSHWHSSAWKSIVPFLPAAWHDLTGASGWIEIEEAAIAGKWPTSTPSSTGNTGLETIRQALDRCTIRGNLSDVTIQHSLLPQPIYNAAMDFAADLNGLRVSEFKGTVAEGQFHGNASVDNWQVPQIMLQVQGNHLSFNERWTGLLSQRLRDAWANFKPQGVFDCNLVFVFDSDGSLRRRGTVDVRDMSYVYHDFPLPVSKVGGRFTVRDNDCQFQLASADPRCPVTITGFANDMGPQWTGKVEVQSSHFHAYSDDLLEGLSKKPEAVEVIRQMNLAGQIAVNGIIEKTIPDQPAEVRFNVGVHAGEIRHRLFPYRIFGLSGLVQFVNGTVSTEGLEGVSSTGNICIRGQVIPRHHWWVDVIGQAVELNQELYQALSPAQQSVWDQINPRGELDQILVRFQNEGTETQVSVSGYQQPSTAKDPSNLRIEPTWFRYSLERLSGRFHYHNGQLSITSVQGWHGAVPVSFDAQGQMTPDSWQLSINQLLTGQIPIDHDIKNALPQSVRAAAERVNLSGSMAVQGSVVVSSATAPNMPQLATNSGPSLAWELRLDLENAALDVGLPVQHVHGSVSLRGTSDNGDNSEGQFQCSGNLNLDSLMVQGIQLTSMKGPYWSNDQHLLFGTAIGLRQKNATTNAAPTPAPTPASVTAYSLGGRLSLDGQVSLREDSHFQIQTTAHHIDLAKLATHWAPETRDIAGLGSASLVLKGTSAGQHSLDGQGMVRIYNARLYEIPFFLQLLKTLQVKTPDKSAFDEGSIDFDIRGSDIECHRIELNGDTISLIGNGRANLNHEVDLNFYTVLGRNRFYLPVLTDLLHAGSQQLMWISVKGPAEKPVLRRETFRALNEAVRLLLEQPPRQFP